METLKTLIIFFILNLHSFDFKIVIVLYRIRCVWQFFLCVCVFKFEYFEFFLLLFKSRAFEKVRLVSSSSRFRIVHWVVNAIWISQKQNEKMVFFRRNDGNKWQNIPGKLASKIVLYSFVAVSSLKWVRLFNNFPEFYRNETIQLLANFMDGLLFCWVVVLCAISLCECVRPFGVVGSILQKLSADIVAPICICNCMQ